MSNKSNVKQLDNVWVEEAKRVLQRAADDDPVAVSVVYVTGGPDGKIHSNASGLNKLQLLGTLVTAIYDNLSCDQDDLK
jgi:hypothetical protein